jgi:stage II sporulation protein D
VKTQTGTWARRGAALVLSAVLAVAAAGPLGQAAWAATPTQQQPVAVSAAEADAADAAGDTIGGANTALVPTQALWLEDLELDETNGWLADLFGTGDTITVSYLYVKGKGLQRNVKLDITDCLVGITYTELGAIGSYVSASAAAEAWRAQAIAIHSYLEYNNSYGSASNALTYTPVSEIPASTRQALYSAIEPVAHYLLVYGGIAGYQVCDAVFSASAGYNTQTGVYGTCSSKDAWGTAQPYLQSVESKYERTYHEKLRRIIGRDYTYLEYNDSKHPDEPYTSADTTHKSLGGYVLYNTLVSNGRRYTYINQFASARFCFDFGQDADGTNVMTYYGLGHGVGLSQCGAVGYAAEEGYTYQQILQKYYTGTSLLDTTNQTVVSTGGTTGGGLLAWLWQLLVRLLGLA